MKTNRPSILSLYTGEYQPEGQQPDDMQDIETITPKAKAPAPLPKEDPGILGTVTDVVKSVVSSPLKEIENLAQTGVDIANFVDDKLLGDRFIDNDTDIDLVYNPKTGAGKVAQTLGAFATGYVAGTKLITAPMQGAKVMQGMKPVYQKAVQNLVAGGAADFVTGDTSDQRLADVLIENPKLANPLLGWLASNPDDTQLEARAKNAVEGFFTGLAVDGAFKVFKGIGKALKAGKRGVDPAAGAAAREASTKEITEEVIEKTTGPAFDGIEITMPKDDMWQSTADGAGKAVNDGGLAKAAPDIPIDGLTMTREAAAQSERKESAAMFNYGKFTDATQDVITAFDKPVQEAVGVDKMSMSMLADDTLQEMSNLTGDIFGRMDDLKAAVTATDGLSKEVAYHTALMQYEIAPRMKQALQLADDGAAGASEGLYNLVGRTLEELVNVKKLYRNIGRGLKSADILAYMKAEDADSLIAKAYADPLAYAKETVGAMTEDEIVSMARKVTTAQEIGGNVMQTIIDSLPAGNAMAKAGRRGNPRLNTFKKYWYASMLSSPKTQLRNLGGNSVKLAAMPLERAVYGMAKGAAEGYKESGLTGAAIGAMKGTSEGYYFLQGLRHNLGTAWEMSKIAFSNGTSILRGGNAKYADGVEPNSIFSYLSGYDAMKKTAETVGKVGKVADGAASKILGLLNGADEFFAQLVYGAEVHAKLMTSLNKSGVLDTLADKAAQKGFIEKYLADNYDRMYRDVMLVNGDVVKGGAVFKEALDMANDVTFQSELGTWGKGFTQFVAKCPPMQFIFPFQKTPINLFKDAFWIRSPWGAVADIGKGLYSKNPEEVYRSFGHLATASLLWYEFYNLVAEGKITGAGPKSEIQRTALKESGWQPYTLKTDNGYLNLSSFEPFGSGAMLLADIAEICQRGDIEAGDDTLMELSEATLNAALRFSLNRTYLQGLADLVGSANRDNAGAGYISGLILSFIPNAFKDTAQAIDPTIYQTKTLVDKAKARLGMTDELAPKTSWLFGTPIAFAHGGGLGAFNPFIRSDDTGSSVTVELSKMNGIGDPQMKINGAELTPQEYSELCRLHGTIRIDGKTLYEALESTIASGRYDVSRSRTPDLNDVKLDDGRNEMLEDCIRRYRKRATAMLLRENPDIQQRVRAAKAGFQPDGEKRLAGIVSF